MSSDAEGSLAYGYGLGTEENMPDLAWYIDDEGFSGSAERALLASVGFTETWSTTHDQSGYHARKREAETRLGVEILYTGTWDYSGYILAAIGSVQRTEWSDVREINLTVPDGADEKLRAAIKALPGLKLVNDEPKWLLSAFYG